MSFTSDYNTLAAASSLPVSSRFDAYFHVYGTSLKHAPCADQRTVTLIARSPASPVAQSLALHLGRFEPGSIDVNIIFAQVTPADALNFMVQALEAARTNAPEQIIRWAKNRALLDAHERLTLGTTLCWTGDTMRRTEDTRSAFDRVDETDSRILAEASASFRAIWKASKPLPKAALCRPATPTVDRSMPSGPRFAAEMQSDAYAARLEDLLRTRRH